MKKIAHSWEHTWMKSRQKKCMLKNIYIMRWSIHTTP